MKKKEILNKSENNKIDWGLPMWVISKHGFIILTTGENNIKCFSGTCLPCESYLSGSYSDKWVKSDFIPLEESLTIVISN